MVKKVIPGADLFLKDHTYKIKDIALITNHTGITSTGIPVWKVLRREGYTIKAFFSPEHGLHGEKQDAVPVKDTFFNGIPVHSLFGTHEKPTEASLKNIDTLLYDIQDIGCRYYTYLYTLAYTMEVCNNTGTEILVLDRPNPVGTLNVEGNEIPPSVSSFVGNFQLPNIYRLTVGEFARYLKSFFFKNVNLQVVPMENYSRSLPFQEYRLPWIAPSPNIPTPLTAVLYPGTCLFEGTNISEGRGTAKPFEIIGAPWIDGETLREKLRHENIPGALFTSTYFTPAFSKYQGEQCEGVCLHITDLKTFKPLLTGIIILSTVYRLYPEDFTWKLDWEEESSCFIDKLTGFKNTPALFERSRDAKEIYSILNGKNTVYLNRRSNILLYPDSPDTT